MLSCAFCGSEIVVGREDHPYREAGLHHLTLVDVQVSRCSGCPYYRLGVKEPEALHRAIAERLIAGTKRLTGPQVRYLRKCLVLSETDLARRMGVTIETVSRWEHGTREFKGPAERLLSLMVAGEMGSPLPPLECVGIEPAAEIVGTASWNGNGWDVIA